MANLNFINSLTINQFKKEQLVERLDVKPGKTGSLFFSYGPRVGAVSKKGIPTRPMVSLVHPEKTEEPTAVEMQYIGKSINGESDPRAGGYFYLLHNEGDGVETIASF